MGRIVRSGAALLHAPAVAVIVEAVIRHVSLPRLARLFGVRLDLLESGAVRHVPHATGQLTNRHRRRLTATRRLARHWPFGQGMCLRSALVAGHLLRDAAPVLHIGLVTGEGGPTGHAWLEVGGRVVLADHGAVPFPRTRVGTTG